MGAHLKTLARGIQILKFLAELDEPVSLTDISGALDIERTAAYRCLVTLAGEALATQDGSARWHVHPRAALLAPARIRTLAGQVTPILRDLTASVGRTTALTVAHGDTCMALKVCEPHSSGFHITYREGTTHASDRGASGLAILANEPPRHGERAEVEQVRTRGYAHSVGELQPNAYGYAAAVPTSTIRASVGVISLDPLSEADFLSHLLAAAEQVAEAVEAGSEPYRTA